MSTSLLNERSKLFGPQLQQYLGPPIEIKLEFVSLISSQS